MVASYSDLVLGVCRIAFLLVCKIVSLQICKFSVTFVAFRFLLFYYSDQLRFLTISGKISKLEKPFKKIKCITLETN